jgi:hypothetical protein
MLVSLGVQFSDHAKVANHGGGGGGGAFNMEIVTQMLLPCAI